MLQDTLPTWWVCKCLICVVKTKVNPYAVLFHSLERGYLDLVTDRTYQNPSLFLDLSWQTDDICGKIQNMPASVHHGVPTPTLTTTEMLSISNYRLPNSTSKNVDNIFTNSADATTIEPWMSSSAKIGITTNNSVYFDSTQSNGLSLTLLW